MANTIFYFMLPEDEAAFFRELEQFRMEVYPEVSEPGFQPPIASAAVAPTLTEPAYYLAMPQAGELVARVVKRGKDAGMYELDEVKSPVFHYERSVMEDGELRSGRIWSELAQQARDAGAKSDLLRTTFDAMRDYFKRRFRKSSPTGFFVGPAAARKAKEGLVLREAGRKGITVVPYK